MKMDKDQLTVPRSKAIDFKDLFWKLESTLRKQSSLSNEDFDRHFGFLRIKIGVKTAQDKSARYLKSNFYEQLVEHAFISELLQEAWFRYGKPVEVLGAKIDNF